MVMLKCPHCVTPLLLQSMTLLQSFVCPKCHASLRISRIYRIVVTTVTGVSSLGCLIMLLGVHSLGSIIFPILWLVLCFVLYIPSAFVLTKVFPPRIVDERSLDLFESRRSGE